MLLARAAFFRWPFDSAQGRLSRLGGLPGHVGSACGAGFWRTGVSAPHVESKSPPLRQAQGRLLPQKNAAKMGHPRGLFDALVSHFGKVGSPAGIFVDLALGYS
jgi:hypothetical protein